MLKPFVSGKTLVLLRPIGGRTGFYSFGISPFISGVGNTTIQFWGNWELPSATSGRGFNPLTLVAEPCALACQFGIR